MAQYVALADRAFVDENYQEAIDLYGKALQPGQKLGDSTPSQVHEARAYAHFKLQQYMEAVQDASKAIELDPRNAKAYLRKGMACYKLEEYETALLTFHHGLQAQPNNPQLDIWIQKCKNALTAEGQPIPDLPAAAFSHSPPTPQPTAAPKPAPAKAPPKAPAPAAAPAPAKQQPSSAPAPAAAAAPNASSSSTTSQALAPAAVPEFLGKYRHQWYQINNKVVIDVYAKGLPKEAVSAALSGPSNDRLVIRIAAAAAGAGAPGQQQQQQQQHAQQQAAAASSPTTPAGAGAAGAAAASTKDAAAGAEDEDYVLELDLFGRVSADVPVKVEVLRTKVEVTLVKADPALHWGGLEKGAKGPPPAGVAVPAAPAAQQQQQQQEQQQGPPRAYPSSKGPKDWSKFEAEVKELEEKGELEDGDPLNSFFKKIFAQGDEDTRRAMMKSFVESNGTVLSTNWNEVGAKKIDCTPPEGMELHKWTE